VTVRVAVRIACTILALALLAAAVLGIVEIILAALGRDHLLIDGAVWDDRLRNTRWEETENQVLAGLVAITGLGLLLLAWWPRRQGVVGVGHDLEGVDARGGTGAGPVKAPLAATMRRASLERALARAVAQVDTVTGADVKVEDDVIRVNASTARRQAGDLPDRIQRAVDDTARRLALGGRPTRVRVRTAGGSS
jgi:hypothetical protein